MRMNATELRKERRNLNPRPFLVESNEMRLSEAASPFLYCSRINSYSIPNLYQSTFFDLYDIP